MDRLFAPFIGPPGATALLLLRVVMGSAFVLHGWHKIQHPFTWMGTDSWAPGLLQALAAFAEFGGGIALIIGLLTPLACLGLMSVMATAVLAVHLPKGDPFVGSPGSGSFELPLLYFVVAFTLMLIGPGIYSLDAKFFRRKTPMESFREQRPRVPV